MSTNASNEDDEARRLREAFRTVRQGHVFAPMETSPDDYQRVIISQTCDVVLPKRPSITAARVVRLNEAEADDAGTGTSPRFIRLRELGDGHFADLSFIDTFSKRDLLEVSYKQGIDLSDDFVRRDFSLALARWFGRFPFPDEVVPWLQPVERVVRTKYESEGSDLGRLLRDVVVEIRAEADQWLSLPLELQLHVVVRGGALPTLPAEDEPAPMSKVTLAKLYQANGTVRTPAQLAQAYWGTGDRVEQAAILGVLGDSFADLCVPAKKYQSNAGVMGAVTGVTGQVWSDDEFPLSRVRKSEPLDLEYLSEPAPLA